MEIAESISLDSKIQRYMDLPKFLQLLESSQIFLSKISSFDDKLEGGLTHLDAFLLSGVAERLDFMVNRALPGIRQMNSVEREEYQAENDRILSEIDTKKLITVFGEYSKRDYSDIFKRQKDWLDVCCWHQNEQESMAMWKIYGAATSAVCIETTVQSLADSVRANDGSKLYLSDVDYIDYKTEHFQKQHILSPYLHKSKFYLFEQEIRLIKYNPDSDLRSERTDLGSYLDVDLNRLIKVVRVSPEAPNWFFELIVGIVKNRYKLNVDVEHSRMKQEPIFSL